MAILGGINLKKTGAGTGDLLAGLERMRRERVLIGIPEDENTRKEKGELGNAALLFLHSEGSPARGLPRRQVIQPAIKAEDNRARLVAGMKRVAQLEVSGDHDGALAQLAKVGIMGANASKRWFTDPRNGWPPNKRATVLRKLGKLTGARRRKAFANLAAFGQSAVDTVLIDTAQMRRALTSVVDDGTLLEGAVADGRGDDNENAEPWENAE